MTNTPFTINAGERKTLLATFADSTGINHPLGTVPVAECATKEITLEPKPPAFTVEDVKYEWWIIANKKAMPGPIVIVTHAKNMAGDVVEGKIDGMVTNLQDTTVNLRVE